jgi:hypothetical protein
MRTLTTTLYLLTLSSLWAAEAQTIATRYDPTQLPKGYDYFELRDGLANAHRKFEREKTGRIAFLGGSITAGEMASGKPFDAAARVGFGAGCFQSPWTDVSSAPGSAASPAAPPIPCACRA